MLKCKSVMGSCMKSSVISMCNIIMFIFKCYSWEEKMSLVSWFFCGRVLLLFILMLLGIIYLMRGI